MTEARTGPVVVAINALWHREHTLTWSAHHAYQLGAPIHIIGCVTRAEFLHQLPQLKRTMLRDIAHIRAQQPDLRISHSFLTDVAADSLADFAERCEARALILAPALTMQPESANLIEESVKAAPCKVVVLPNEMRARTDAPVVAAVLEPSEVHDAATIACRYAETRDIPVTVIAPAATPTVQLPWWKKLFARPVADVHTTDYLCSSLDRTRNLFPHVQLRHHPHHDPRLTSLATALSLSSSMLVTTLALAQEEAQRRPTPHLVDPQTVVMSDITDSQCAATSRLGYLIASGVPTVLLPESWRHQGNEHDTASTGQMSFGTTSQAAF